MTPRHGAPPVPTPGLLADGSPPASEADVHALLEKLGVHYQTVHHPPVFTVAQAKALRGEAPGSHIKNLFLRNRKGRMWLITCHEDRSIDLKQLGERLGAGRLSFASAERMMGYLGVTPGAVTPLAAINDRGQAVQVVIDREALRGRIINVHPLHNAATTSLAPDALLSFLRATDHEPVLLDMQSFSRLG